MTMLIRDLSRSASSSLHLAMIKPDMEGEEWPAGDVNYKTLIGNPFILLVYIQPYKENSRRGHRDIVDLSHLLFPISVFIFLRFNISQQISVDLCLYFLRDKSYEHTTLCNFTDCEWRRVNYLTYIPVYKNAILLRPKVIHYGNV